MFWLKVSVSVSVKLKLSLQERMNEVIITFSLKVVATRSYLVNSVIHMLNFFHPGPEDNRSFGRLGGCDRAGQPPVGPAGGAQAGQDVALLDRSQVRGPGPDHRCLRRLQVTHSHSKKPFNLGIITIQA